MPFMPPPIGELRTAALSAVREACTVTELVRTQLCGADTMQKKDLSPVTCADFAAQAIMILLLRHQFPGIPFVAEEDAEELVREDTIALLHLEGLGGPSRRVPGDQA